MLWEPLPREWGADPWEDPSCHPLSHCICLPQTGSAGDNGQVDTTGGFVPPASSCGQTGFPGTGNCCHHSCLLLLPKPPHFSSPATSSLLSSSPHLHPHLHPLKRPGAARTKHDRLAYRSAHPITVPTCPSLPLCPHLSTALLLTNQLFIALCVPPHPIFPASGGKQLLVSVFSS